MRPIRLVAAVLPCLLIWPGAAAASASTLLYERTLLAEADRRCDLFDAPVSAALISARAQARGAALRASTAHVVRALEGRALAKAAQTPCDMPGLLTAAARVRSAYQGWSRINHMTFRASAPAGARTGLHRRSRAGGWSRTPAWAISRPPLACSAKAAPRRA
jgi:hypothetical protein